LQKKEVGGKAQVDPVFTYLVSEIGESRDARRTVIAANDMTTMAKRSIDLTALLHVWLCSTFFRVGAGSESMARGALLAGFVTKEA
jgi:hypothetical protein